MRDLLKPSRGAVIISGTILMAAAIFGTAQAATDTIYKYSTPKTGSFTIDNLAMSPTESPSPAYENKLHSGLVASGFACFSTGVNLPHGAILTKVVVYYRSASGHDVWGALYRQQLSNASKISLASATFAASNTPKAGALPLDTTPASNVVINNNQYSYSFGICLEAGGEFYATRITYTYEHAGD
jgi:hypothetical protein